MPTRDFALAFQALFDRLPHAIVLLDAQRRIWAIQGQRNSFYCGAHFGAGFHEDGLQSGLAVAEMLGATRPWTVADPNGRLAMELAPAKEAAA